MLATFVGGLTSSLLPDSGIVGFAVPNRMVFLYLLLVLALYLVRHYLLVNKKLSEWLKKALVFLHNYWGLFELF
ncbi:TPA: hypothetical protein ACGORU_001490 [Streptococcus suis]